MLTTIGHYLNPLEAHIVRGRIEAEGIPAFVQHEQHVWANWTISLALGYVKVQVNQKNIDASLVIIKKLQAGDYALQDEEGLEINSCPKCSGSIYEQINRSWKVSLWLIVLISLPIPYTAFRVKCIECNHVWTQKELRGYPLCMSAFAIFLVATGFAIFERTFYYVCKINYLSKVCI